MRRLDELEKATQEKEANLTRRFEEERRRCLELEATLNSKDQDNQVELIRMKEEIRMRTQMTAEPNTGVWTTHRGQETFEPNELDDSEMGYEVQSSRMAKGKEKASEMSENEEEVRYVDSELLDEDEEMQLVSKTSDSR